MNSKKKPSASSTPQAINVGNSVISTDLFARILATQNGDALGLYAFILAQSAIRQDRRPWLLNSYFMEGLSWGKSRVQDAKSTLINLGLIKEIVQRENGKITGHFIEVVYANIKHSQVAIPPAQIQADGADHQTVFKQVVFQAACSKPQYPNQELISYSETKEEDKEQEKERAALEPMVKPEAIASVVFCKQEKSGCATDEPTAPEPSILTVEDYVSWLESEEPELRILCKLSDAYKTEHSYSNWDYSIDKAFKEKRWQTEALLKADRTLAYVLSLGVEVKEWGGEIASQRTWDTFYRKLKCSVLKNNFDLFALFSDFYEGTKANLNDLLANSNQLLAIAPTETEERSKERKAYIARATALDWRVKPSDWQTLTLHIQRLVDATSGAFKEGTGADAYFNFLKGYYEERPKVDKCLASSMWDGTFGAFMAVNGDNLRQMKIYRLEEKQRKELAILCKDIAKATSYEQLNLAAEMVADYKLGISQTLEIAWKTIEEHPDQEAIKELRNRTILLAKSIAA
jgi:hypothetical protein